MKIKCVDGPLAGHVATFPFDIGIDSERRAVLAVRGDRITPAPFVMVPSFPDGWTRAERIESAQRGARAWNVCVYEMADKQTFFGCPRYQFAGAWSLRVHDGYGDPVLEFGNELPAGFDVRNQHQPVRSAWEVRLNVVEHLEHRARVLTGLFTEAELADYAKGPIAAIAASVAESRRIAEVGTTAEPFFVPGESNGRGERLYARLTETERVIDDAITELVDLHLQQGPAAELPPADVLASFRELAN